MFNSFCQINLGYKISSVSSETAKAPTMYNHQFSKTYMYNYLRIIIDSWNIGQTSQ